MNKRIKVRRKTSKHKEISIEVLNKKCGKEEREKYKANTEIKIKYEKKRGC
jgi:hypothetical protein